MNAPLTKQTSIALSTADADHATVPPPDATSRDAFAAIEALQKQYSYHPAGEILAHPRFPLARAQLVSDIIRLYDQEPAINQLLIDAGRIVMFGMIVCLWADFDPADRATWPTVKRLKTQLGIFGLVSPRHVDNLLARLAARDYLVLRTAKNDRRVRLVEPTERMLSHDLDSLEPYYRALNLLFGEARYEGPLSRDRSFQSAQRKAAISIFPWSARILSENTDIMHFLVRPGAILVLFQIFDLGGTGPDNPVRNLSFLDLSQRFGVSRSHVGNVVRDAEAAGLIARSGAGGAFLHLTPRCVAAFDRFVADAMASSDFSCAMAAVSRESIGPESGHRFSVKADAMTMT